MFSKLSPNLKLEPYYKILKQKKQFQYQFNSLLESNQNIAKKRDFDAFP